MDACDICDVNAEAGVIASIIKHPDLVFYSEQLTPHHFTNEANGYIYYAVSELAKMGGKEIDAYNITNILNRRDETKAKAETILSIPVINDLISNAGVIARSNPDDYKVVVDNVLDAAFRRQTYNKLAECQRMCFRAGDASLSDKIYDTIDKVLLEYSTKSDIPEYKELVDQCWEEIKERQGSGYAGYPFPFPTLNEYATIERGELFIFGAEQKQGKSMMLLDCAVHLLKQDLSVLYIDSELNTRMFTARLIAHLTGIAYKDLTAGRYDSDGEKRIASAIAWIKQRKFKHVYIPLFDQQSIYTTVKKTYHTMGVDVLIIDYFKSSSAQGDAWDSYAELGRLTDLVKNRICGDMNIAGLGAAQATATGKLADSAKIARNASTIAMITSKTPEEIDDDGIECGNKKLRVVYNRNGMQMAQDEYIDMVFDGNHILYQEAKQHMPVSPF